MKIKKPLEIYGIGLDFLFRAVKAFAKAFHIALLVILATLLFPIYAPYYQISRNTWGFEEALAAIGIRYRFGSKDIYKASEVVWVNIIATIYEAKIEDYGRTYCLNIEQKAKYRWAARFSINDVLVWDANDFYTAKQARRAARNQLNDYKKGARS